MGLPLRRDMGAMEGFRARERGDLRSYQVPCGCCGGQGRNPRGDQVVPVGMVEDGGFWPVFEGRADGMCW